MKRLLITILLTLISCDDPTSETVPQEIVPEKKVYYPVDSGSWDGKDTVYNEHGMRKIFAKGHSFYPRSREELRCSLTYNYFIDTTEVTEIEFWTLIDDKVPGDGISEQFSRPVWTYFEHAILYCNERSKTHNLDTVYEYDSLSLDTNGFGDSAVILYNAKMNISANGFRLPLSTEWTYAYRGGYSSDYFWGDDEYFHEKVFEYGWIKYNSDNKLHSVGLKAPNQYGLYDMIGNLEEAIHLVAYKDSLSKTIAPTPISDSILDVKYARTMGGQFLSRYPYPLFNAWDNETFPYTGFRTVLPEEIPESWK